MREPLCAVSGSSPGRAGEIPIGVIWVVPRRLAEFRRPLGHARLRNRVGASPPGAADSLYRAGGGRNGGALRLDDDTPGEAGRAG